uniref:Putative secreted protein n=1 Tax=Ixodes scapularis TaxID=6945 RepID=A0A4D5RX17_IXOSC
MQDGEGFSFAIILVLHLNIELMLCRLEAACTTVLRSLHPSFVFLSGTIQRSLCLRIALLETMRRASSSVFFVRFLAMSERWAPTGSD